MKYSSFILACCLLAACQTPPPAPPKAAIKAVPVLAIAQTERGVQFVLPDNILFDSGQYAVKPEIAQDYLQRLAQLAKKSDKPVSVEGHTDNVGSDTYNQTLSLNRAKSVRDILQAAGVPLERLRISGFSFSHPVASNASEEGRKFNRRTEVIILDEKIDTITQGEAPNSFEVAFARLKAMMDQGAIAPAHSK